MNNDKNDIILDNMLNKFCKVKPTREFGENLLAERKEKRNMHLRIAVCTAIAACITIIMTVFIIIPKKQETGLSKKDISLIDKSISDYKTNYLIGFNDKIYDFKTVNELVYFINNAKLNKDKFKMLYELNYLLVPEVPASWGELDYVSLDTRGILEIIYKSNNIVPMPTAIKYEENPYGITPIPSTPAPVNDYYNFHCITIWTHEATDLVVEQYTLRKNPEIWITLDNGIAAKLWGGSVTWLHKMKYMISIWDKDEGIVDDANNITFKKVKLNLR